MRAKVDGQLLKMLILRFAGIFGSSMLSFAIGLYILQETGSALSMGISLVTGPLVSLILTPFVGYIVDNKNHKKIMLLCQFTISVALALFALIFQLFPEHYYIELIFLIIVLQITDNFFGTTIMASLVELFPEEKLQQVNSLTQSVSSVSTFLAPIMGSIIYSFISLGSFALLEIIFELVAFGMILGLKFNPVIEEMGEKENNEVQGSIWENFREGFSYIRKEKLILIMMLTGSVINFFFAAINVGLPFVLVNVLHFSNSQYGLTESAFALGMFIGGIILSKITLKRHPMAISYLNLLVVALLLIAMSWPLLFSTTLVGQTVYFFFLNSFLGIALVFVNTPINTFMQQVIPGKIQGRIFSLSMTLSMILMPMGTLFYGMLFDLLSPILIFIVSGIIIFIVTLSFYTFVKRKNLLKKEESLTDEPLA